jgi:hypothetical protein
VDGQIQNQPTAQNQSPSNSPLSIPNDPLGKKELSKQENIDFSILGQNYINIIDKNSKILNESTKLIKKRSKTSYN